MLPVEGTTSEPINYGEVVFFLLAHSNVCTNWIYRDVNDAKGVGIGGTADEIKARAEF